MDSLPESGKLDAITSSVNEQATMTPSLIIVADPSVSTMILRLTTTRYFLELTPAYDEYIITVLISDYVTFDLHCEHTKVQD